GIVLCVEADAALFVTAAKLMVVSDVPVVHDGEIGITMAPERLRMTEIDAGFGREPRVTDAVRALVPGYAIGLLKIVRRTGLPHDLRPAAHADDLEILVE